MGVAGSSPGSFSRDQGVAAAAIHLLAFLAPWPSGKAEDCKSFIPGSNPGGASWHTKGFRGLSPGALWRQRRDGRSGVERPVDRRRQAGTLSRILED